MVGESSRLLTSGVHVVLDDPAVLQHAAAFVAAALKAHSDSNHAGHEWIGLVMASNSNGIGNGDGDGEGGDNEPGVPTLLAAQTK